MNIQLKPGLWKTRDGRKAVVEFRTANPKTETPWSGYIENSGGFYSWRDDGVFVPGTCAYAADIISPWTEPKLRPWKPEEVPVGATLKTKDTGSRWLLIGINNYAEVSIAGNSVTRSLSHLLECYTHSLDGGKTWLPCGVMEGGE